MKMELYESMSAFRKSWRFIYWQVGLETLIWPAALVYLAIHNPYAQTAFTLCPLEHLGFHYCPGCGLGRAVSFLLHGDLQRSLHTHILGFPATVLLLYRTYTLLRNILKPQVFRLSTN